MKKENTINYFLRQRDINAPLDPTSFRLINTYLLLENMSVRLIDTNRADNYYNLLAQDIKIENNRKDYTITLKEAFFSDGSLITAHDVVQSFKRLILFGSPHSDPKSFIREAQNLKSREDKIEGLRVIDKRTLFIGLNNPMKEIFYFLQLADYGVLHHSQYSKDKLTAQDWTKITSGAYHLSFENGKQQFIANTKTLPYHPHMATKVFFYFKDLKNLNTKKLVQDINNGNVHLGSLYFRDYLENKEAFDKMKHISVYGKTNNLISFLILNLKSPKFKNPKTRKWFLYKILKFFSVEHYNPAFIKKAYQYFLPDAKGHLSESVILKTIENYDYGKKPPSELIQGITITSVDGMKKHVIPDLQKILEKSLGIPVKINFDNYGLKYYDLVKEKKYDVFLTCAGMSYKVIGEALNLMYTASPPHLIDPSGNIKKLLQEYQKTDFENEEEPYLRKILLQMLEDAESVPLFYMTKPFFTNNNLLSGENVSFNEVPQLWKFRVK